jgi:hypothetical protein
VSLEEVRIDALAVAGLAHGQDAARYIAKLGQDVRDRARLTAASISNKTDAIISVPGEDVTSVYADVGYDKHHPGFFLWWWEVGTVNHPPRPHLRPAFRQLG